MIDKSRDWLAMNILWNFYRKVCMVSEICIVWISSVHLFTTMSGEFKPHPWNFEVLTKLSQIPSFLENTSITTYSEYGFHSFANWVEPLTRGLPPPDLCSLCPLSSIEFVETPPPPRKKFLAWPPPLPPKKICGYATDYHTTFFKGFIKCVW
jgi:hypothetical protein